MALGNPMAAALGSVQKALLVIHKEDAMLVDSSQVAANTQAALAKAASSGVPGAGAATMAATSAALTGAGMKSTVLQVQYNPASLSIQANAEPIPFTYLQQNIDSGIPNQSPRPPMVVLSVELIFDAMNPKDAFMLDKLLPSTGGAVSSVAGAIKTAAGDGYTVQPQTDGLVAALMRPSTRVVTFRWADMAFTGQIFEVQAQYTMFSVSGKPIRSRVRMNIAQQVESNADIQHWDQALDQMFQNGNDVSSKGRDQTLGNLLNLGGF